MDYDQMYISSDGRNAPVVVDHRTGSRFPLRPTTTTTWQPAAPVATAPMIAPVAPQYQYPAAWGAQPMWAQGGWGQAPGYVYPPLGVPPTTNLGSILGGFGDLGSLATIAAQILAAFLPLPASPTPQDNNDSDPATNASVNSSNLIRYQNALAQFAKRDQQILTIGSVLKELLKRPGFSAFGG
jgi:hypothetical protein